MKKDRTKETKTPKQNKWRDPFFRDAVLFRSSQRYRKGTHWTVRADSRGLKYRAIKNG